MSHVANKDLSTTAQSVNTFTNPENVQDFNQYPDARGHFGVHGGRFVSETLMQIFVELYLSFQLIHQLYVEIDHLLISLLKIG